MEINEAYCLFENEMNITPIDIERCGVGIGNFVFIISTQDSKYVLRCSKEEHAYDEAIHWLYELEMCKIPIPKVVKYGKYDLYSYLILTYSNGNDIGNIYKTLTNDEKKQIAKEVIEIQNKVSKLKVSTPLDWNWNVFIDEMISRAYERISINEYFDLAKVNEIKQLHNEMQQYFDLIQPIPYLDDISTKNLLIDNGKVSSVIDIDWIGLGDILTFVALTKVALLNMDLDTIYIDFLLEEVHPSEIQYKAFVFYCLLYCVDFMSERGMNFLDKKIPINQDIIDRLNSIYDSLLVQWNSLKKI